MAYSDRMADDKEEKSKTGRQLDATGETVRKNIRRVRDDQGITGAELSETLGRLGRPIPPLGIQRIEAGTRRVDVDDLVAFAVALQVSPASLLMPDLATVVVDDLVPITGNDKPITASVVWRWLTATAPLIHGTDWTFIGRALPSWERDERMRPIMFPGEDGHADGDN